ncbi:hypothetical protein QBC33DRAFT_593698 [Phialemonium atrogriseum]|uniref:Uncharacterized protein n=1 Tax=Phialemonium atrogriseum TaxID=1093897 RepID=A0AAJ0FF03_9PEZI|nr:uncharacterized protein QBC33DRAFT_593698 [Phialemonium atrogriseum]KAK1764937.1 hypothetical protein QBC33DRAFT_593698 [Phialemonium atrogriseum]
MARLFSFAAWLVSFALVHATQPDVGWQVEVLTGAVSFSTDSVGDDQVRVFIDAPIKFQRLKSTASSLTLTLYTSPYVLDGEAQADAEGPSPAIVHTETVSIPSTAAEFVQSVFFDLPTESWQDVLLSVAIDDGHTSSSSYDVNGAVLAFDPQTETWTAHNIGDYSDDLNKAIIREIDSFDAVGEDSTEVGDLGEDTVTDTPDDTASSKEDAPPDTGSPPHSYPGGGHGTGRYTLVTVYKTTTECPEPTPPPPPCPEDEHGLQARQAPILKAFVKARVTFPDRNGIKRPIRFQKVIAHADLYAGDIKLGGWRSWATLNANGEATFGFSIAPGQRIIAHTLYTQLEGDYYQIGTRKTLSEPFSTKFIRVNLVVNPWRVEAGQTISIANHHKFVVENQGFWVADSYRTISDYFRTQVATKAGEAKKISVWFPGNGTGTFFSTAGLTPYINIPVPDAQDPSILAHEYGHFAHYVARGTARFDGGGNHTFCGLKSLANSRTSFSEGYATAFGLMAIDQTPLDSGEYLCYRDIDAAGLYEFTQNIEYYGCSERYMLLQEGRIAATIFDLVDRKLDKFNATSDDFGYISPTFDRQNLNVRFTPRLIFWLSMQNNPQGIDQYWNNLRGVLSTVNRQKAWSVFEYNWADFSSGL